jgi:hypothetical protein
LCSSAENARAVEAEVERVADARERQRVAPFF